MVDTYLVLFLNIGKVCLCNTNRSLYHKEPCPGAGIELLQSRNYFKEKCKMKDSEECKMEITRWDNWHVRLPKIKDQQRAIDLFAKSGAKTKSDFVRARILDDNFKVITVNKSAIDYYRKLSEINAQIHKIGLLYNQVVRAINSYHSIKTAQIMLAKLEKYSAIIIELQQQSINITIDYRKR